ncbi:MAG: pyruvate:ferredoxin (flavodoxin) oxidoreductase [Saprospiraceae bacterium]|nr:pyruvate:ferredoxin (flavodoxin) oxidoreductase [Saprospiraceae bacterium]
MTLDANEATAFVAYRVNEVCAIYPITPSSPMAEFCDEWANKGITNIWGNIPEVIEMQHEGGAAGAVHGALQAGSMTTTFTASQGLMLMLPNFYKIAGELTPTVIHVAARSLAAQALSIFGDHSDVMAARTTGMALLASASVQEAHDLAIIAQAATLESRIPFIHFFDGFRTSHEVNKITLMDEETIRTMIDDALVHAHRQRALNPEHPFIRGTAQNPDVYFQGRETVNRYYDDTPAIVQKAMDTYATLSGRQYDLFTYTGAPDADRVVIIMGSGGETATETAKELIRQGEPVGVIQVRLYRPFSKTHLLQALPASTRAIAVLDRTKEPGAGGEPLYLDVLGAISEAVMEGKMRVLPRIIGGRYGLSSKEFTPAMVKTIFDELGQANPKNHFTIGIHDDVTHTSLEVDPAFSLDESKWTQALFYGLGADGTVGANKNSIKIIGENTDLYAQGYFVYDSKKSGARTVSHLRFGTAPIRAPYLIRTADFIGCHQFSFLENVEMIHQLKPGGTLLINAPFDMDDTWKHIPGEVQEALLAKKARVFLIDANAVARDTGMGNRINTIMQTCFFAISGVLPREEAIDHIKKAIEKTYFKKGPSVIRKNFEAVDQTLENLFELTLPTGSTNQRQVGTILPVGAPAFVREVTVRMLAGHGDDLPVSMLPVDGTYPSGTTKWEKRNVADLIPVWDDELCIQCGNCSFVCPHSVIRSKYYHNDHLVGAPEGFKSAQINARGYPETRFTLDVYLEDCTGCNLCVEACPVTDPENRDRRAINLEEKAPLLESGRVHLQFFEQIPLNDRTRVNYDTVHGVQFLEPLFEFSGACAGCGETPYIKVLTQLFGDRLVVANATGCSSIYGGNLPTTPWSVNKDGRGPAWSNSLFEDNAEFGLGMRVSADKLRDTARQLVSQLQEDIGVHLSHDLLEADQRNEVEIALQRARVADLQERLISIQDPRARSLASLADHLVDRSVWLVGGDGWAYDIGSSGLDHVLASGRNVNVLVLDTEVYSNTGGQMSKATPTAATAKFAAGGKKVGKKDLALQAISYGNVYVAQVAMGANPQQTLLAFREAEAYDGPSLILAYSHCIAHGIDMTKGLTQQELAVKSGYWPLLRYHPDLRKAGHRPFVLDAPRPTIQLKDYAYNELRYKILTRTQPAEAERLMSLAQEIADLRWRTYEEMAGYDASSFAPMG